MKAKLLLCALMFLCLPVSAFSADIKNVVAAIENQTGVRHHGIPLLWMFKPFLLGSVGGLKMSIFEDLNRTRANSFNLEETTRAALGNEWWLFIESTSKDERVLIFTRPNGKKLKMLMLTADGDETVVMQFDIKGRNLRNWVIEPVESSLHGRTPVNKRRED